MCIHYICPKDAELNSMKTHSLMGLLGQLSPLYQLNSQVSKIQTAIMVVIMI